MHNMFTYILKVEYIEDNDLIFVAILLILYSRFEMHLKDLLGQCWEQISQSTRHTLLTASNHSVPYNLV